MLYLQYIILGQSNNIVVAPNIFNHIVFINLLVTVSINNKYTYYYDYYQYAIRLISLPIAVIVVNGTTVMTITTRLKLLLVSQSYHHNSYFLFRSVLIQGIVDVILLRFASASA